MEEFGIGIWRNGEFGNGEFGNGEFGNGEFGILGDLGLWGILGEVTFEIDLLGNVFLSFNSFSQDGRNSPFISEFLVELRSLLNSGLLIWC